MAGETPRRLVSEETEAGIGDAIRTYLFISCGLSANDRELAALVCTILARFEEELAAHRAAWFDAARSPGQN